MTPRLAVWLAGERIGTLERTRPGKLRFAYRPEVVATTPPGLALLSHSLPVREGWFTPSATLPFFDGLLPEGETRRLICRRLGIRGPAPVFELLHAIGRDCAGAVVVVDEGEPVKYESEPVKWLDDDAVAQLIDDLPLNPLGIDADPAGLRLSLSGVQPKLVLARDALGRWGLPSAGVPSTHIIKPPQLGSDGKPLYEDIVANELFCLNVLAEAGLATARAERVTFRGRDALVVERFDRTLDDSGRVVRLHQEDTCQALGRVADQKYEDEHGGVRLAEVFALVSGVGASPARERLMLLNQVVANYVLGNADAHAKNISVLYPAPGVGRLAPLYDVLCTAVYKQLTTDLSLRIGGVLKSDRVDGNAMKSLAREVGLAEPATARHAASLARRIADCARAMVDMARAAGWFRPVLEEIAGVAAARAERLAGFGAPRDA